MGFDMLKFGRAPKGIPRGSLLKPDMRPMPGKAERLAMEAGEKGLSPANTDCDMTFSRGRPRRLSRFGCITRDRRFFGRLPCKQNSTLLNGMVQGNSLQS